MQPMSTGHGLHPAKGGGEVMAASSRCGNVCCWRSPRGKWIFVTLPMRSAPAASMGQAGPVPAILLTRIRVELYSWSRIGAGRDRICHTGNSTPPRPDLPILLPQHHPPILPPLRRPDVSGLVRTLLFTSRFWSFCWHNS